MDWKVAGGCLAAILFCIVAWVTVFILFDWRGVLICFLLALAIVVYFTGENDVEDN